MAERATFETVDRYIASFPADIQARLELVRQTIRDLVPAAVETISYQIPTFKLDGKYLIYFAGYKAHVGVYPVHVGPPDFEALVGRYRSSKATIRFSNAEPLPLDVVGRIVNELLAEAQRRAADRASKQKPSAKVRA